MGFLPMLLICNWSVRMLTYKLIIQVVITNRDCEGGEDETDVDYTLAPHNHIFGSLVDHGLCYYSDHKLAGDEPSWRHCSVCHHRHLSCCFGQRRNERGQNGLTEVLLRFTRASYRSQCLDEFRGF